MHIGKLLSFIDIILNEFQKKSLLNYLRQLKSLIKNSERGRARNIRIKETFEKIQALLRNLGDGPKLLPSQVRILEQMNGTRYVPWAIKHELQLKDLQNTEDFLNNVLDFYNTLFKLKTASENLGITKDELKSGKAEVGVGIPPKKGTITLDKLINEARAIDRVLKAFSELAGETIESPKLRVISSSWFEFFMLEGPVAALLIATTIERIVALYKNKLEIEKLRKDLGKQKVPKPSIKSIEEHEKQLIEKGLNRLAESFLKKYYKGKAGRKNEVRTSLHKAMRFLANRIDHGFSFEVRVQKLMPPKLTKTQDQAKKTKAYQDPKKMVEKINRLGCSVAELNPARKPILMLPPQKEPKRKKKKKAKLKVKKYTKVNVKKKTKVKIKKKAKVKVKNYEAKKNIPQKPDSGNQ
ncbi:MAG: hypothetical protein GY845_26700 [Planctomycetes bacterium]|nr:hypothetical protein [Planctomycetota bacterium]